jgi:hypothetical protein
LESIEQQSSITFAAGIETTLRLLDRSLPADLVTKPAG